MSFMDKHKQAGGDTFMKSMAGLANVLAFIAAFLGTGPLFSSTVGWVTDFTLEHYGQSIVSLVSPVWGIACAALIFFIARASIGTALMFGAGALLMRFL